MANRFRHLMLSTVATCSLASALSAQARVSFGPVVGANIATVGGADAEEGFASRLGLIAGLFATVQVSPSLAVEPQLLWSSKGVGDDNEDDELAFNYIQVPVLARFRFPGAGRVTPFLTAGPSFAIQASCRAFDAGQWSSCDDAEIEVSDADLSLIVGAGLEIGVLNLAVRYDYGLSSLDTGASPAAVYNRGFAVTVGVSLAP